MVFGGWVDVGAMGATKAISSRSSASAFDQPVAPLDHRHRLVQRGLQVEVLELAQPPSR